MLIAQ